MSRREKIEKMLQQEPDDVFLNFGLAMELVKEGRHDEALARFDQLIGLDPAYVAAYAQKANVLLSLERKDEARDCVRRGIDIARQSGDDHAAEEMSEWLATIQ